MSVLMAVVRNSSRVNVDFLFTSCEEAGFCGVVSELLEGSVLGHDQKEEVVCIVVDSSSRDKFIEGARLWEGPDGQPVEIPLQNPVVRSGDVHTVFDLEVTKLLCTAASNLQRSSGNLDRMSWAKGKRVSLSEDCRKPLRTGDHSKTDCMPIDSTAVLVGRMVGGWCEATPLRLEAAIRQRYGKPPLGLRTGSLAIPIAHYRNSFENRLQPEKCHENALRGAVQVLGEALRLCHRWPLEFIPNQPRQSNRTPLPEWMSVSNLV